MKSVKQEAELYGPNWETVMAIIDSVGNSKWYLSAKEPAQLYLLENVVERFQPFSKEKLEVETVPFQNFSDALAARDAARDAAGAPARAAARDAAWAAAWAAASAVVKDKMPGENPFMALMDLWLNGYLVYFDGKKIIAAYVA